MAQPLVRFLEAQETVYATALAEIRAGCKLTHWMWFIFPQVAGLGQSTMARHYALADGHEAQAYAGHPILGERYTTCVEALQALPVPDAVAVFGGIDAIKLRSSLTLFGVAAASGLVQQALGRWFGGQEDAATLRIMAAQGWPAPPAAP